MRIVKGSLQPDESSLAHNFDVRGIEILKEQNFRKISLVVEKKPQIQIPPWYSNTRYLDFLKEIGNILWKGF